MRRERNLFLTVAAMATLSLVACSDDDSETAESLVENIEQAARTAVTEAEEAARTAISEAEAAIDEAGADAAETAVRNLAAEQGEEEFADSGNPIDDDGLSCEATANDDLDSVHVEFTGTTENGEAAELSGDTSELPGASITQLEGTFTGSVDGAEVFTTDVLGG
jgi:FKBP-type peptidyl-prolyl cis-trans isomerase